MTIQESSLNRMVHLAYRGQYCHPNFLSSAFRILRKCGLNEEQQARIADILRNVPSDDVTLATHEMKRRILTGETVPPPPTFPMDVMQTIFWHCPSNLYWESFQVFACTSKYWNQCTKEFWDKFDLKVFCPELTILDAKAQGITVDDEPCISNFQILKGYRDLALHVENNEGVTLLTMVKGMTMKQLMEIAAEGEITVEFFLRNDWECHTRDAPIQQTYVIMITNNVFEKNRDKSIAHLKECVVGHGCEMPLIPEYVALNVFTHKIFKKYLYTAGTYACSSEHTSGYRFIVGGIFDQRAHMRRLRVSDFPYKCLPNGANHYGAGGRRKL